MDPFDSDSNTSNDIDQIFNPVMMFEDKSLDLSKNTHDVVKCSNHLEVNPFLANSTTNSLNSKFSHVSRLEIPNKGPTYEESEIKFWTCPIRGNQLDESMTTTFAKLFIELLNI